MTFEISADEVDDVPAFATNTGRDVIDILPHRGLGKDAADTVLSRPAAGVTPEFAVWETSSFTTTALTEALNRMDTCGYDVFRVVPHRHGQVVRLSVYGVRPARRPRGAWYVVRADDYRDGLVGTLRELSEMKWSVYDIMPYREGRDNFPVVIACRPHDPAE